MWISSDSVGWGGEDSHEFLLLKVPDIPKYDEQWTFIHFYYSKKVDYHLRVTVKRGTEEEHETRSG